MEPHLRLYPGQQALTPAQEAEAHRFAEAYIQAQLSTEPVDEQEAEALLRQAYEVAGLAAPQHVHWLDGPLQLVALVASGSMGDALWRTLWRGRKRNLKDAPGYLLMDYAKSIVRNRVENRVRGVRVSVLDSVGRAYLGDQWDQQKGIPAVLCESVVAYEEAHWFASYRFFDVYLAPNDLHAMACFNQMVSGYWLGKEAAVIVRRPRVLSLDAQGRLHNASGKCMEYPMAGGSMLGMGWWCPKK